MTKTLNQMIFFSSTKIRIFFSATLGIRIFFQKKTITPPLFKLNGHSLSSQELFKQTCIIKLHKLKIKYSTIKHFMQYKINTYPDNIYAFLCFDFWTPTASAHVASASLADYPFGIFKLFLLHKVVSSTPCHEWDSN